MITRLRADQAALESRFGALGSIREITGPHSDLHENHSAVYFVRFEKSCIVYKPRSMAVDCEFARLNNLYFGAPMPAYVLRSDYGWMEFITGDSTPVPAERWGYVLALLTLLRSSDHHSENVITSGGWPWMIDMECTFAPEMTYARRQETRFSPRATRLGLAPSQLAEIAAAYLQGLMTVKSDLEPLKAAVGALQGERMRVLIRQTEFYQSLMEYSLQPEFDGNPEFRWKSVRQTLLDAAPDFPEVCGFEADRICRGIIPKFVYDPMGATLQAGGRSFSGLVAESGWRLSRATLDDTQLYEELSAGRSEILQMATV